MLCTFCDKKIKDLTFLESKNFRSVYNISPILEGHSLIIPKKHIETTFEFNGEELKEMFELTNKTTKLLLETFSGEGFDWVLMNGDVAGSRIPHIHLHVFPRMKNDGFSDPRKFFFKLLETEKSKNRKKLPLAKLKSIVLKLRPQTIQQNLKRL